MKNVNWKKHQVFGGKVQKRMVQICHFLRQNWTELQKRAERFFSELYLQKEPFLAAKNQ